MIFAGWRVFSRCGGRNTLVKEIAMDHHSVFAKSRTINKSTSLTEGGEI